MTEIYLSRDDRIILAVVAALLAAALIFSSLIFTLKPLSHLVTGDAFAARQKGSGSVVIEQSTRRVLYAQNADEKLYPASTTKILTALVVLERLPLDTVIEIGSNAIGIEGSSIYLTEGERLTAEELLLGMMLRSGNDAAQALALAVSNDVESFAELMNQTAKDCGAVNSHFVNPHGLQDERHYTTAKDLALITARAFENEAFCKIVSSTFATVGEGEHKRYFKNKNRFLTMFEGANGVKTGFTETSGRCLVTGAKRDGMQLICVTLNCSDDWRVHADLLQKGFDSYEMVLTEAYIGRSEGNVEVRCGYDGNGTVTPQAYPLKKDGSEDMKLVFG